MKTWTKLLFAGLLSIVLGMFALGHATIVSIGVVWVTGILLLLTGAVQIVVGVNATGTGNRILWVLLGLLLVALGISFMSDPLEGTLSLSALIAIIIGAGGILRLIWAYSLRRTGYFWMMLISASLSILLAGYIFANFSTVGVQLLGILLGIELIFNGSAFTAMALFMRNRSGNS